VENWRKVPSSLNPADVCSHGAYSGDPSWNIFLKGSDFLSRPKSEWPQGLIETVADPIPEVAMNVFTVEVYKKKVKEDLWALRMTEKIECWDKKLCRIAHLLKTGRALLYYHQGGRVTPLVLEDGIPNLSDIHDAEITLVREIQATHFSEEIDLLLKLNVRDPDARPELRKQNSTLLAMDPFVDESGVLRTGGRLELSTTISLESKCPMILQSHDVVVESLVHKEHRLQLHTLATLRNKFFIVGGRTTVRRVNSKCVTCQKAFKKTKDQKMAPLPADCLDVCVPFKATGMDVFGPFSVIHGGKATTKRWVLLFTCMACRVALGYSPLYSPLYSPYYSYTRVKEIIL
jgi:hypothetical protein